MSIDFWIDLSATVIASSTFSALVFYVIEAWQHKRRMDRLMAIVRSTTFNATVAEMICRIRRREEEGCTNWKQEGF